jgi:uncharacterized protein (TIGR03083 family)
MPGRMHPAGTRLTAATPIPALEPLRSINAALLDLLVGLAADDWAKPTVHADRNVKDLTAHLLHGSLRRVTALRDHYHPPTRDIADIDDLIAFIQEDNRDFMNGMKRISPGILIELIRKYDAQLVALFEGLDPDAPGLGVAWAGEEQSPNWFDIARECTEKWHHQQQLRDATGRPPLYDPSLLAPVLETFARGLPYAYRRFEADDGAALVVSTSGPVSLAWTLRRSESTWTLWSGAASDAAASISVPCDVAWRLWTKSMDREDARAHLQLAGDPRAAEPVLDFVAIMA